MFRVLSATLLITLLALPHGICFCELLQTAIVQKVELGDDENTPDDHEKDCSCKLRHAMASLHVDDHVNPTLMEMVALDPCNATIDGHQSTSVATTHPITADPPVALIPCALRI